MEHDSDDCDDSYEVACKDLASLIKWNIEDHNLSEFGGFYKLDNGILDEWENLVCKAKELGRRATIQEDGWRIYTVHQMINRVITFPRLCRDLQSNDPKVTTVAIRSYDFPSGYCHPLGKALNGNSHVSSLNLELSMLLPRNGRAGTQEQGPLMVMQQHLQPLLHYIESGPALRKLALTVTTDRNAIFGVPLSMLSMVDLFLRSAASSPNLEELNVRDLHLENHVPELCALLEQTTSLRTLDLRMSMNMQSSPEYASDCEKVARALGTNGTLEALIITIHPGTDGDSEFVDLVVSHLSAHPCLKDFDLRYRVAEGNRVYLQLPSLPTMLQSSTLQLRSVSLQGCAFNSSSMEDFVSGLNTNRTLEKVVFDECHLDEDAKAALLRFLQSTNAECKLRELGFRAYWTLVPLNGTKFDSAAATDLTIQVLQQQRPSENGNTGKSIGSLLERFTFDFKDSRTFWPAYAFNASKIRLPYLHLGMLAERDWEDLKQYLPSILYLRELSIDVSREGVSASTLIRVLRRNGSVQVVHMKAVVGIPLEELTPQTPMEKRLHESILLRNQHVPKLLASPRLRPSGASDGAADRDVDDENTGILGTSPPTMIPPLFQVMAPAERMQPNTVLMGLLAFKNSFGASSTLAAKRSLPIVVTSTTVAAPLKLSRHTKTSESGN